MAAGMNAEILEHVQDVIRADIAAGLYHGAVLQVARGGQLALDCAIGCADEAQTKPLVRDSVFNIFSVTKAFTNVLALRAIGLGQFALTSRISDLIPEFLGHGREKIQVFHLLSHQAGFPIIFEVKPGMYIDRFDEVLAAVIEVVEELIDKPRPTVGFGVETPGGRMSMSRTLMIE